MRFIYVLKNNNLLSKRDQNYMIVYNKTMVSSDIACLILVNQSLIIVKPK